MSQVVVVIGAGSIGIAIALRNSAGKHILLADLREETAEDAAKVPAARRPGGQHRDRGRIEARLSRGTSRNRDWPRGGEGLDSRSWRLSSQAPPATILAVDLYGTALVLETFGDVIAQGGAGVVIASQSGHRLPALTAEQNKHLATTPADELLRLPMLQPDRVTDPLHAYQLSKRGNLVARPWLRRCDGGSAGHA